MPALITPFTSRGDIDLDAHRENLLTLAGKGIEGFVLAGSTGEGPLLGPGERNGLVAAARQELGQDVFLLCGIAADAVRHAVDQAEEAAAGGADAALAVTPTSVVRNNDLAVGEFYVSLADRARIPVFLYSVPGVTAYQLPVGIVQNIASHSGIVGMKDSSGDPVRMAELRRVVGDLFHLYVGSSPALSLCLAAGATGAITSSANYLPALVLEVVAAADPRGHGQLRLTAISRLVERHRIPGVKAAALIAGLRAGYPRAPLRALPEATAASLREAVLAAAGAG